MNGGNGGAVALTKKYIKKVALAVLFSLTLAGCGQQVSFEKIDYKGHVRIENDGVGYCFKIPEDWEIRLKLEGSDVVCLAPTSTGFHESIVATSIPGSKLTDPGEAIKKQLGVLGSNLEILEPWSPRTHYTLGFGFRVFLRHRISPIQGVAGPGWARTFL